MAAELASSFPGAPTSRRLNVVSFTQELVRARSECFPLGNTERVVTRLEQNFAQFAPDLEVIRLKTERSKEDTLMVGRGFSEGLMPRFIGVVHVDTVAVDPSDNLKASLADGKIFGRGASDSKGSAAAMVAAITDSLDELPGSFALVFTSDEEFSLNGIKAAVNFLNSIKAKNNGIEPLTIVSGGNIETVGTGSRGCLEGFVRIKGEGGHSAFGITAANVDDSAQIAKAVLRERVLAMSTDQTFGVPSFSSGGTDSGQLTRLPNGKYQIVQIHNMIPTTADVSINFRLNGQLLDGRPANPQTVEDIMRETVAEYGHTVEPFEPSLYINPNLVDPKRVQWMLDIIADVTGKPVELYDYGRRGLDESVALLDIFPSAELVIHGAGTRDTYHASGTMGEYVEVSNLHRAHEIYRRAFTDPRFK